MGKHFRILGILYVAMGAISILATMYFAYALYGTGVGSFEPDVQRVLTGGGYGGILLILLALVSIGTLLTGYALLKMHKFARTLARVFAILGLLDFPLGTMLGVYTLWVLSQQFQHDSLPPERP